MRKASNYIRYALATFCFAASVGCLALWGWSQTHMATLQGPAGPFRGAFQATALGGITTVDVTESNIRRGWKVASIELGPLSGVMIREPADDVRRFGTVGRATYFPLWYPALIFALAGAGVLRFRRQFSIRSALAATTVVAALIGMAVTL